MKCLAFIKEWQTLVAACIAIIAAGVAWWNTTRQLRLTNQLETFRRARKQAALRAVLPLTLSEVTRYAIESFKWLGEAYEKCDGQTLPHGTVLPSVPRLPTEAISAFQDFIEYSDNLDSKLFEDVLSRVQIQSVRLADTYTTLRNEEPALIVLKRNIESYLIDTAYIYAGVSAPFDYSRRRATNLPTEISWSDVRKAFSTYHFSEEDYPSLHEYIALLEKSSPKPFSR